jgi:hypothetical protein
MLVLPLIKVCSSGNLGRLYPLEPDKSTFLYQINVDLLDFAELNEERIEITQIVKLIRDIVHNDAKSLLFLDGQSREGLPTRRPPGHLSLQGLNLLQFREGLLRVRGLGPGISCVSLHLGGL